MKPALMIVVVFALLLAACQPASIETVSPAPVETQISNPAPAESTLESSGDEPYPGAVEVAVPDTSSAYPVPEEVGTPVGWDDATKLILDGKVAQVTQFGNLVVILVLKDGQTVSTTEPAIDDVFTLIEECGDLCKDIEVPTS